MVLAALGLALCAGGCQNIASLMPSAAVAPQPKATPKTEAEWRTEAEKLSSRYREKPDDAGVALAFAKALRGSGQRTQAVSVLQQASYYHPTNTEILGAYGRALSDVGNLEQALQVLSSAHTPDQPDWRILSAQGAVLDQLGRHDEAQRQYATALKIKPDDPSVLSNLGLSYALAKDLTKAEETLRRAASLGPTTRGCGRTSPSSSACRAGSPKPRASPAPTCRPRRPPPTSRRCAGCSPSTTISRRSRNARSSPRLPAPDRRSAVVRPSRGTARHLNCWITLMTAGPRMTMNSTGRKNRIIGTVSCGGSAAAFFSAAFMR
jgi:Flp pilus assembly protein TadD